jgi:hypothetical protein
MPEYYVSRSELKAFMTGALNFVLNHKDGSIGYPADENRLVQHSIWYSLDDSKDSHSRVEDYADALFSSRSHNRLEYGDHWVAYVQNPAHAEAYRPHTNLLLFLSTDPTSVYDPTGTGTYTFTLRTQIANSGNIAVEDNVRVSFWDGPPGEAGSHKIGSTQVVGDIPGCGDYQVAEVVWTNRSLGPNVWYARVERGGEPPLIARSTALVASEILYLPIIRK